MLFNGEELAKNLPLLKELIGEVVQKVRNLEKKCSLRKKYIKKIYQIMRQGEESMFSQKKKILEKFAEFFIVVEERVQLYEKTVESKIGSLIQRLSDLKTKY